MHKVPHLRLSAILAAIFMFHATVAGADDWQTVCERLEDVPTPEADHPSQDERRTLGGCSSEALYYGIGRASDPESARKCAYLELEQGNEEAFGGAAMLMTIYANGRGAERNYDLAISFACDIQDAAPAEMEGRIQNLLKKKEEKWRGDDFSVCSDLTSGLTMGMCAAHGVRFDEAKRTKKWQQLMAGWSEAEREAFATLRKAANAYFDLRVDMEVDQSSRAWLAFGTEERNSLENGLLGTFELLEQGQLRGFSKSQFKQADKELNSVYRKIHEPEELVGQGTISQEGIRETQRAWIVYRDAWVAFAKIKYPAVAPESVMAYLTLERTDLLKQFLLVD